MASTSIRQIRQAPEQIIRSLGGPPHGGSIAPDGPQTAQRARPDGPSGPPASPRAAQECPTTGEKPTNTAQETP
eukprot:7824465-Pyramimonas_sp.AAC.1